MTTPEPWPDRSAALADDLRAVIEAVDDLTFEMLRAAARQGQGRPAADKRLLQVRRALDKAVHLLETFGDFESPSTD